eukprot:gene41016-7240_t
MDDGVAACADTPMKSFGAHIDMWSDASGDEQGMADGAGGLLGGAVYPYISPARTWLRVRIGPGVPSIAACYPPPQPVPHSHIHTLTHAHSHAGSVGACTFVILAHTIPFNKQQRDQIEEQGWYRAVAVERVGV